MRVALILLLACTAFTGCRINPNAEREIALLRAEILDLEDQYYSLQAQCGGRGETVSSTTGSDTSYVNECINCDNGTFLYNEIPGVTSGQNFSTAPQSTSQPNLQTDDQLPAAESENADPEILPDKPSPDSSRNRLQQRFDTKVASVDINRRLSKGQDLDGKPGHEGLALLIQPKDNQGRVLKTPGHLTVRVIEHTALVSSRQIGMWQFTPDEIESFFVKDDYADQGILLHLPWDKMVPNGQRINVFVRYVTPERRTLDSTLEISIEPPDSDYSPNDPVVAEWIERDDRWREFGDDFREDLVESFNDNSQNTGSDPAFRVQESSSDRRNSASRWRPVR